MLVVLDVNVLVSSVLSPDGPCVVLLDMVRDGRLRAVVSPRLLAELEGVLARPKLRRQVSPEDVERVLSELTAVCRVLSDSGRWIGATRDPKDDYLVALAVAAGVDLLVSGDKDLLAVDPDVVRVVTPREAVDGMGT